MSLADAFLPAEEAHKSAVMHATWGHPAPEPRRVYPGAMVFAFGEYGSIVPISASFKGLSDSPWFFNLMDDFICKKAKRRGTIYKFVGTFMMFKNGNGRFTGKTRVVRLNKFE